MAGGWTETLMSSLNALAENLFLLCPTKSR
jgi:hypothetical protein